MKRLRNYQRLLLFKMLAVPALAARQKRRIARVGVAYPQGSGKTLMLLCYCALVFGRGITHIVIAAPQSQITRGWMRETGKVQVGPMVIDLSNLTTLTKVATTTAIETYVKTPRPSEILIVTHAAVTYSRPDAADVVVGKCHGRRPAILDALPEDLTGYLLIIDEAHHNRAPVLRLIYDEWGRRGGLIVDTTATPYRTDGKKVMEDSGTSIVFSRSYALHASEGYAPSDIMTEILPVPTKDLTKDEWLEAMCSHVVRQWEADGRPKGVAHIPVIGGSDDEDSEEHYFHVRILDRLHELFTAAGARVYDAHRTTSEKFNAMLDAEGACTHYSESQYDMILALKRMDEGTDWPFCAAVYFINMPRAQWLIEQVFGRGTRDKRSIAGYPSEWVARIRIAFFMASNDPEGLVRKHDLETFISCCMLADHRVGQRITNMRQIKESLERALGHHRSHSAKGSQRAPEDSNEVTRILEAVDQLTNQVPPPTRAIIEGAVIATESTDVGRLHSFLKESGHDVPEDHLRAHLILRNPNPEGAKALGQNLARHARHPLPHLDPTIKALIAELASEFGEKHINIELDAVSQEILSSTAIFNTQEISNPVEKIAKILDFADKPIGDVLLQNHIRTFVLARKRHPSPNDGLIEPGLRWLDASAAVRDGKREVTQHSSWYGYCRAACGIGEDWAYELAEQIPNWPDLDDDAALNEFGRSHSTLCTKDTPSHLRAIFVFGPELVAQLESLNQGSAIPLGVKTVWRQWRGRGQNQVEKFSQGICARISAGETFTAADIRREVRDHLNPKRDVHA